MNCAETSGRAQAGRARARSLPARRPPPDRRSPAAYIAEAVVLEIVDRDDQGRLDAAGGREPRRRGDRPRNSCRRNRLRRRIARRAYRACGRGERRLRSRAAARSDPQVRMVAGSERSERLDTALRRAQAASAGAAAAAAASATNVRRPINDPQIMSQRNALELDVPVVDLMRRQAELVSASIIFDGAEVSGVTLS